MSENAEKLSHLNAKGEANMVDVSAKNESLRTARAEAQVKVSKAVLSTVQNSELTKGDVLTVARIAGIQAAKQCSNLIPLCHPLPLSKVSVDIQMVDEGEQSAFVVSSLCKTTGKTGVEMEALTAASVAALTIYDMCKALDKGIEIQNVRLLEKTGGKSGDWVCNV